MAAASDPHAPTPRLARVCAAIAGLAARRPRPVLACCLAAVIASLFLASTRLQYRTQRDDLMSAQKECRQRWQRYLDEFGADDDVVFVVQGSERARMESALESTASALRRVPDHFDRVFWKVDLTALRSKSLLFLPLSQVQLIREQVGAMGPLLGPLAPLAWRELGLRGIVDQARSVLLKSAAGETLTPADRGLLERLGPVVRAASVALDDPPRAVSPWEGFLSERPGAVDLLDRPQYFFSDDGSLAFLLARPGKAADRSFTPALEAVAAARSILADRQREFPDLQFGLTGLPVLENDEMNASDEDTARAAWLALAGVGLLYLVVYRGLRYPLLTVATLLTGTVWALGLTTLTVGYLTILSATFAVMLIGMGDYGVLWVARYTQERRGGLDVAEATRRTAEQAGPAIVTAAATTALAFYATTLADFQAVAELGVIAGSGVLLCALACLTVMPALLAVVDRRREAADETGDAPTTLPMHSRRWLPGIARRPRTAVLAGGAVFALFAAFSTGLEYDHNLLHMQSQGLDSVRWERQLLEKTTGASWHALSTVESPEAALSLKNRYEQLPAVSRVAEIASLIPADQPGKAPLLADLRGMLRWLPTPEHLPVLSAPDPARLGDAVDRLRADLIRTSALVPSGSDLSAALDELRLRLNDRSDLAAERLRAFDERLRAELRDGLARLRDVCGQGEITLADLPAELRERFVSAGGTWLLRVYARDDLWEYGPLTTFVAAARSVDPEATGKPFGTLEGLRAMQNGFLWAGVYALGAIVLVLAVDLRSAWAVGLVLLPLAVGLVSTLGVLALFGLPLNPANLIALPLIVGVGVDNGVHVLHDFQSRDRSRRYQLGHATGRGVLVAALTTVLGFGALMVSRHAGLFGLGLTLTLGVGFSMLAALVVLPAVLSLVGHGRERPVIVQPLRDVSRRAA